MIKLLERPYTSLNIQGLGRGTLYDYLCQLVDRINLLTEIINRQNNAPDLPNDAP